MFHTDWHPRNGGTARLAALAGAGWVRAVPDEFTPSLAVRLPLDTVEDFPRFAADSAERHDELFSAFARTAVRAGEPLRPA